MRPLVWKKENEENVVIWKSDEESVLRRKVDEPHQSLIIDQIKLEMIIID